MIKRTHRLLMAGLMLLMLRCPISGIDLGGSGEEDEVSQSDRVATYPVSYSGILTVTVFDKHGSCSNTGTARVVINSDLTCAVWVTHDAIDPDLEGECHEGGYSRGWSLTGVANPELQYCKIKSCNDGSFTGYGDFGYNITEAKLPQGIKCQDGDQGATFTWYVLYIEK